MIAACFFLAGADVFFGLGADDVGFVGAIDGGFVGEVDTGPGDDKEGMTMMMTRRGQ